MTEKISLHELDQSVWQELDAASAQPADPYRYPVVASPDRLGDADARVLVLRSVRTDTHQLIFHTDLRSDKCAALAGEVASTVVFYDHARQRQYRFRGVLQLDAAADSSARDAAWLRLPPQTRMTYCGMDPGLPLPGDFHDGSEGGCDPLPEAELRAKGFTNFAILTFTARELRWLQLARGGNREAGLRYLDGAVEGAWLSTS